MAARVLPHPLFGVDDQQRRRGLGGSGDHVPEELYVSRSVDDDVVALRGHEVDARGFDRDALRLLVLERVEQEGVFKGLRVALAVGADSLELALREAARLREEPADDGALAVVDVAGDH